MWRMLKQFKGAHPQTKFFIFNWAIYILAIIWTTVQAYARLEYSRTGVPKPIIIQIPETSDHS
jgi:hypothetical protein